MNQLVSPLSLSLSSRSTHFSSVVREIRWLGSIRLQEAALERSDGLPLMSSPLSIPFLSDASLRSQDSGLGLETKTHLQRIPRSQRSGEVIEPMLSEQWFIKMDVSPLFPALPRPASLLRRAWQPRPSRQPGAKSCGSCPRGLRRCGTAGWRTYTTGVSLDSSGGATASQSTTLVPCPLFVPLDLPFLSTPILSSGQIEMGGGPQLRGGEGEGQVLSLPSRLLLFPLGSLDDTDLCSLRAVFGTDGDLIQDEDVLDTWFR
jgi:hypothetical protein